MGKGSISPRLSYQNLFGWGDIIIEKTTTVVVNCLFVSYTSTQSFRGYIFTAVCVCVCLSLLVNKIPVERMHRFIYCVEHHIGCQTRLPWGSEFDLWSSACIGADVQFPLPDIYSATIPLGKGLTVHYLVLNEWMNWILIYGLISGW